MALLILRAEQGRLDELAGDLRELGRDGPLAPAFRSALGWLHAQCGRSEEAGRLLATVVPEGIPDDWHWRFVTVALAAETSARLGDVARAAFLEAELAPLASYVVLCEPALFSLGSARRPLAAVQAAQGRSSEAVRTYEEALAHNEQLGALPWVAHTCTELASTLMARGAEGDAARAEQLLDRAAGLAEDLSMPVLAGRVRTLRRDRALGHRAEGDLKASGPTVEP
jgi:tetratricopeptide (TPR) repeat protein